MPTALWACAAAMGVFAGVLVLEGARPGPPISVIGAGVLFGIAALGARHPQALIRWAEAASRLRLDRIGVAGLWAIVMAVMWASYASNGWDECSYLLGGLALRGYPTPYAAHRPPITGLLAALFVDAPQALNPVLLVGLLVGMAAWGTRRWGPMAAMLPLLLLLGQNAFLDTLFDVMSELPAAVMLLAAFGLLAGAHFLAAGAVFALASLARWNLALVALVLTVPILVRFGVRPALRYIAGGALVAGAFLGLSALLVDHPVAAIVNGNLLPAAISGDEWARNPAVKGRAWFYLSHFLYVTPPGVAAVCYWLVAPASVKERNGDWCVRSAIPIAMAAYVVAVMNLGRPTPRFIAPIVPLAMFVVADLALYVAATHRWSLQSRAVLLLGVACITLGHGFWPGSVLSAITRNVQHRPAFSASFRDDVARAAPGREIIQAPAVLPLAAYGGLPAMCDLRRTLDFPAATRDSTFAIVKDRSPRAVAAVLRKARPGSLVLLPASAGTVSQGIVLARDRDWVLYRVR